MSTQTPNYNLIKPADNETADIQVINGNMDIIDTELKENAEALATHLAEYATFKECTEDFKTDYEYQAPVIVGTQIQLVKQSNTNILKFKLDSTLTGSAITISLDAGATSKPLKDIEGVALVELEKGYVEVINDALNFTLRPKGGGKGVLGLAYSGIYGATNTYIIKSLAKDSTNIYVGGQTLKKVCKYDLKLNLLASSITCDYEPICILLDDLYVYAITLATIYKFLKSNMSTVSQAPRTSSGVGTAGNCATIVGDYIYACSTDYVNKINKNTLENVAVSEAFQYQNGALACDGTYIYCGTNTSLQKYYASTLGTALKVTVPSILSSLVEKGDYIYISGRETYSKYLKKVRKSDLVTEITMSPTTTNIIDSMIMTSEGLVVVDEGFIVYKINNDTLAIVEKSCDLDMATAGYGITGSGKYFYVGAMNKILMFTYVAYKFE